MAYAVIVDGFSSGKLIYDELLKRNINCIHILSDTGRSHYGNHPEYYELTITFSGCYKELLTALEKYNISYVFAGCETGVVVAEMLANMLGLPGNNPATTDRRRNKQMMQEAIYQAGLEPIHQITINSLSECRSAIDYIGSFPVIVKSLDDGASINTFCCYEFAHLEQRLNQMLQSKTSMGKMIDKVLIQEMLLGTEYIINSVSYQGIHFITDMWRYRKVYIRGGGVIAIRVQLVNKEDFPDIINYVKKVLDALDIKFGAAHTEVIQNGEKINLVETGARLMGGGITYDSWQRILTNNQVDGYITCLLEPEALSLMRFDLKEYACLVLFPIYKEGKIIAAKDLSYLVAKLLSVNFFHQFVNVGDMVNVSKDDMGPYYGVIFLIHESKAIIEFDLDIIGKEEDSLLVISNEEVL